MQLGHVLGLHLALLLVVLVCFCAGATTLFPPQNLSSNPQDVHLNELVTLL